MTTKQLMQLFPQGVIFSWYATSGSVPDGWAVCDGSNGTPDLRDRFQMGVSDFADVGRTLGSSTHSHNASGRTTFEVEGTRHGPEGADNFTGRPNWNHKHDFNIQTSSSSNIPPAMTMLFIMKL